METIEEDGPSGLEHLHQDVVVYIANEVSHLVMCQIEPVELGLQVSRQPSELLLVRHGDTPAEGERVLDLLELEHEAEDFVVVAHHFLGENSRKRGQV